MSSPSSAPKPSSDGYKIGDRFLVERVLGRGGMGEVLAVLEPATGSRFALKRLLPGAKPRYALLLQREFHTLSSLQHPNIVRAFDFGSAEGVPYYTMELLEGSDIERLAPLPWTEVVPILRDVASALALIHARRLVHRDVGARNVWRTPDGRVKLIDFGALTSFGASSNLAGTPPYVAPEAPRTHVLDQRTDLYALGALAYLLLTGRHAYPARSFAELEQHWAAGYRAPATRMTEPAHTDLPALPDALDQLIEALLSPAPEARPSNAAEVLDRLDDVLPGTSVVSQVALDGILASKAFVGRTQERKRLRSQLTHLAEGTGASLLLTGPRGVGRSRLLAEFATEARLTGVHVLQISGGDEQGMLSAAARAVLKLLEILPRVARSAAAPHAAVLGHLSEQVRIALELTPEQLERFPELAGEGRLRVQAALQRFWESVVQEAPVVLLLDDLQAMDEASLALFTTLGREAKRTKLLIIAALRNEPDVPLAAGAQAFAAKAHPLALRPLSHPECEQMLQSIFGDAEHLSRTAQHLADCSEGNPGQLMELCEFLVHGETIRCIDGAWVLPQETSELVIPDSFAQLGEARLLRASPDGQLLARAFSIVEGPIGLELCAPLSPLPPARLFRAIDELCAVGVLAKGEQGYVFRNQTLRLKLQAGLAPEEAREAHRAAGEALLHLEAPSQAHRVAAGLHLLRGGRLQRGAEVVHEVALEWTEHVSEGSFNLGHVLEQAYSHVRELPLHDAEKLSFLSVLATAGFFTDRRLGFTYGDEALRCGQEVCGMTLARRLAPWLGKTLSLYVALFVAGAKLKVRASKSRLVPDLASAIRLFMTASGSLAGMYTLCLAREKVLDSARAIEPLAALGRDHVANIVYQFALACAGTVSDRIGEARALWQRLMERLRDPRPIKQLTGYSRDYYAAASMYAWGSAECWSDRSRALEFADWLQQQPLKLYQLSADQVRAQYYAQQGKTQEVAACRSRIEVGALQRGMTWQVELWWPCSSVALATRQHDAFGLKRALGQLRHLTADTPSLGDFLDYARGSYHLLRGRPAEAVALLQPLVTRRDPNDIGYANIVGLLASAYNQLDRFEEAERVASRAVSLLRPTDLDSPGLNLRVRTERCLALSGLGQHEEAAAELDDLLERFLPEEGPLTLGALHEARARVALNAADEAMAQRHFEQMERWYRSTDCSPLIQHCNQVMKRWAKRRPDSGEVQLLHGLGFLSHVSTHLLSGVEGPRELLQQLVRGAMAREGVLVYTTPTGQRRTVTSRGDELPAGLLTWIDERLNGAASFNTETEDVEGSNPLDPNEASFAHRTWRLLPLLSEQESSELVVGALVLCDQVAHVPLEVQRIIAAQLTQVAPALPSTQQL